MQPVCVMTVAGSDSGGGAGIEADLRTFAALGVHGTVALTAITAQNSHEVRAVCALEAEMVLAQIDTVRDDMDVVATKTGMLARPRTVAALAARARDGGLGALVVDPVLVTSTGHPLMEAGGVEMYRNELLPQATIVTPNLLEACVLAGVRADSITSVDEMVALARSVLTFGSRFVLVKGGHYRDASASSRWAPDVLVSASRSDVLDAERVSTRNDHGTGCSMAAAITARLALGDEPPAAVRFAKDFVLRALRGATTWHLGKGHGPIDHMGWEA